MPEKWLFMLYQSYEKPHPSRTQRPIYGTPLIEQKIPL